MAGDSRGVLLGGAILMLAAAAGVSTTQGEGWMAPMSILLGGILATLLFTAIMSKGEQERGSTPLATSKSVSTGVSEDSQVEDLPDPSEAGIDLPIL